ncbi:MAG: VIT domain-containing protein [Planctomycetota bacterium]
MYRWKPTLSLLLAACVALPALANEAPAPVEESETAPPATGQLTIRGHDVDIVLNNGFATTTVKQTLENASGSDQEAVWSMPLPREAALCELSFEIDGKRVVGEVVEVARAREIYENERAAGRDAGLAEKKDYRYYQVSLARVRAGALVEAHVVYIQTLDIDNGVGRYVYPLTPGNTDDGMDKGFWTMEKKTSGRLRFDVRLKTAFGVDGLHCPSHGAFRATPSEGEGWTGSVELPQATLDKDFVLYYRLRADLPARVELMTHKEKDAAEGTFLAVVTPGQNLARITAGRDWIFLLDVSGSMKGEKIRMLSRSIASAIGGLPPGDRFKVVLFNNGTHVVNRAWIAAGTPAAERVRAQASKLQAGGGTALYPALTECYGLADADRSTAIVLVSDGAANIGPKDTRSFRRLAEKHDIRLFTFAIGNGANWPLLRDVAETTGGFPKAIGVHEEIGAHLMLARERMSHEALHAIRASMRGATELYPRRPRNLYLGEQLVLVGKYDKPGKTTLAVRGRIGGEAKVWEIDVELPAVDADNPEIERLYALAAIRDLERGMQSEGENEDSGKRSAIDLALRYSIVTDDTAMVVVDPSRKSEYNLGDANTKRRAKERAAASHRAQHGQNVRTAQGRNPHAGSKASHAPSRAQNRRSADRATDGGGNRGGGAIGSFWILVMGLLFAAGFRRKDA